MSRWKDLLLLLLLLAACGAVENSQVGTTSSAGPYDRSSWGRWADVDKDCRDTRQEVLEQESLEPVEWDEKGCRVESGLWRCPYTGAEFVVPGLLDIDHVVALAEASAAGGWKWERDKKREYFNDLRFDGHLLAVDRSANRSKGARGPGAWLPADLGFRCEYLQLRLEVLANWQLDYDCALYKSLMAEHCRP